MWADYAPLPPSIPPLLSPLRSAVSEAAEEGKRGLFQLEDTVVEVGIIIFWGSLEGPKIALTSQVLQCMPRAALFIWSVYNFLSQFEGE